MEYLQNFYAITMKLLTLLESELEIDRDEKVDQISDLLSQREKLMHLIKPPFSVEEQLLGQNIVSINKQIDGLLLVQKKEIQADMKQLNEKKKSSDKYINPYQNVTIDGMFYDKRN